MSGQPYQPDQPMPPQYPNQSQYEMANDETIKSDMGGAYAQSRRESYVSPAGNRVESRTEVFENENLRRANIRYWITRVTYFVLGVLEVILVLRFIFRLLGANRFNSFVTLLYSVSHVFVGPFNGIFNDQALGSSGVFEVSTLIAMLIYALIAWGIVSLGRVIFAPKLR